MSLKLHTSCLFVLLMYPLLLFAQGGTYPVALNRQLFHDQVIKAQGRLLALDGRKDRLLTWGNNDSLNTLLTKAATTGIDTLRQQIEMNNQLSHAQKLSYLRGLAETLVDYLDDLRKKKAKMGMLPLLMDGWQAAYTADSKGQSIAPVLEQLPYNTGKMLLMHLPFEKLATNPDVKQSHLLRLATEQPEAAMWVLGQLPANVPFTDSLIQVALKYNPGSVYTFAQAENTPLGQRLAQSPDTAVQLLVRMAANPQGQLLMPFYDELLAGRLQQPTIEAAIGDSIAYYRLLVKTAIAYAQRTRQADTPGVWKQMRSMLHTKAIYPFVNTINALHGAGEAQRFKIINPLSPEELYYLIVSSETEIYTSSYMGVYRRIWQRMASPRADSLLERVQYDQYRKFISMAANYNTLDQFLSRMEQANATLIMQQFVQRLDRGRGADELEDAVDVANCFGSIRTDSLKRFLLAELQNQYDTALLNHNHKGTLVYRMLNLILGSSMPGSTISLPDSLGIEPVFTMPQQRLLTDTGIIVAQVFFYDDPMVLGIFNGFVRSFNPRWWKVEGNEHWVSIYSTNGTPIFIFANRAAPKENGTDERNQRLLAQYLQRQGLRPTITIHRGHSYVTNNTIAQMSPISRIVFLGSCGASHLIRDVLNQAPNAHIIATKQIGKTSINRPFFQLLTEKLRAGQDIEWIPFWKQFGNMTGGSGFEDYIPPHQMLGAILLNAYNQEREAQW